MLQDEEESCFGVARHFSSSQRKATIRRSAEISKYTSHAPRLTLALSSFFTPLTQKKASPTTMEWKIRDETLLMGTYRAKDLRRSPTKVAAFDLVVLYQVR